MQLDGLTAAEVIRLLDLKPHPEGGHYRETFRDGAGPEGRGFSTAIYYLLDTGETSEWHRVDAAEIWHHYAGAPLVITVSQLVVPAGWWQSATSLGAWTLVGCTVAPGFEFKGFEMALPGWRPTPRKPSGGIGC